MNEYEPYMQDTGHRPFEFYDPVRQRLPRVPALMLLDRVGRALYPLSAPTWHDAEVAERYRHLGPRDFDEAILFEGPTLDAIAARFCHRPRHARGRASSPGTPPAAAAATARTGARPAA